MQYGLKDYIIIPIAYGTQSRGRGSTLKKRESPMEKRLREAYADFIGPNGQHKDHADTYARFDEWLARKPVTPTTQEPAHEPPSDVIAMYGTWVCALLTFFVGAGMFMNGGALKDGNLAATGALVATFGAIVVWVIVFVLWFVMNLIYETAFILRYRKSGWQDYRDECSRWIRECRDDTTFRELSRLDFRFSSRRDNAMGVDRHGGVPSVSY